MTRIRGCNWGNGAFYLESRELELPKGSGVRIKAWTVDPSSGGGSSFPPGQRHAWLGLGTTLLLLEPVRVWHVDLGTGRQEVRDHHDGGAVTCKGAGGGSSCHGAGVPGRSEGWGLGEEGGERLCRSPCQLCAWGEY